MLPKILYDYFFHHKYRFSLPLRFGFGNPRIIKNSDSQTLIWIHAVSVGETRAVSQLAKKIKNDNANAKIVISSITETGHAEALKTIPEADYHVYLPFDFKWIIKRVLKEASPDVVLICETDFWWNFLDYTKSKGAKIGLVNGKVSARSAKRLGFFRSFAKRLFGVFDCLCVQNSQYQDSFIAAGAPKERMMVTGNLKFDESPQVLSAQELVNWRKQLHIQNNQPVITIGSTHDPEEKILISTLKPLWDQYSDLKVILVPRHPERFNAVADFLRSEKLNFGRLSQTETLSEENQVILVDTMGRLRGCYQISDAAIVAGSYVQRVGGHNILEPIWFGVPVVFGSFMHSQPDLLKAVKGYEAGLQLEPEQLLQSLPLLLSDTDERQSLVRNGKKLLEESHGSTQRTFKSLKEFKVL